MSERSRSSNCPTVPTPDVESNSRNGSEGAHAIKAFDTQVDIHVHSVRKRLADSDGISAKAAIDGLVHSGVLANDSPKEVRYVTFSQERCKKGEIEKTIFSLKRVNS